MANLKPEYIPLSGEGSIDNELLRDKFTGRQRLFWNQENQSGRKWDRKGLTYMSPNLQLDPRVMYRTAGPNAYADFIKTGIVRGTWQDNDGSPSKLFMSQGAPLWSYGENALQQGENAYLFATLGDNWGNRESHIGLTEHDIKQLDLNQFQLTSEFTDEEHKQIDSLRKSIRALQRKAILDEKQTGLPVESHIDANIDYILRKHEGIIDRISSSMGDIRKLRDSQKISQEHPMVRWQDVFEGKNSGARVGNPWQYALQAGGPLKPKRYAGAIELPASEGASQYSIDTTNLAKTLDYLKPSVSGLWASENILPLDAYLKQLQKLHRTDISDEAYKLINGPDAKHNPFLRSAGWNTDVTTVDFRSPTTQNPGLHLYNSAGEHPELSGRPMLDSYYDYVNSTITPNLVRLGALDDNSASWASPEAIQRFLNMSLFNDVVWNNGNPFPMLQTNFLTHGIQGAMHTERVPRSEVVADNGLPWNRGLTFDQNSNEGVMTDRDGNVRTWGFAANSINANKRPMAVFRINPNHPDGIELVHEFNNDPLPDGTKPIPIKPPSPTAVVESAKRFLDEVYPTLKGVDMPEEMRAKLLAGQPVAGLQSLIAAGSDVNGLWHQMGGITDPNSFYGLQNAVEESTRGNPNYGRKGFVAVPKFLDKIAGEMALEMQSSPASNFTEALKKYKTDPQARQFVKSYTGQTANNAVKGLGLAAYAHGLATDAPSTIVAAGLPFTKFMGVGPVLPLNAGEDEYLYNRDHGLLPEIKPREVNHAYYDYIFNPFTPYSP